MFSVQYITFSVKLRMEVKFSLSLLASLVLVILRSVTPIPSPFTGHKFNYPPYSGNYGGGPSSFNIGFNGGKKSIDRVSSLSASI
jgi:hypothetical protein